MKHRKNAILLTMVGAVWAIQGLAHTRLSPATAEENQARHATYTTFANITHGCGENPVIGHILFMPDQTDSIVETSSDGGQTWVAYNGPVSDFIDAGGFIRVIKNRDTFDTQQLISDSLGNPIGYWAAGGELPPRNWVASMPFRIQAVVFKAEGCAKSITFMPAIADVCQVTSPADFNYDTVDFWVKAVPGVDPASVDAKYFGDCTHSCDSPATFKVTRGESNPLLASCGQGVDVRIYPSMRQLEENFKAYWNNQQIWPAP